MTDAIDSALPAAAIGRLERRIRAQLLAAVQPRLKAILICDVVFTNAVICATLWDVTTIAQMAGWLAIHAIETASLAVVYFAYRYSDEQHRVRAHANALLIGFALFGLFWAVFLVHVCRVTQPYYTYTLYVFLFLGALGILAVSLLADYLPCFHAFMSPPALAVSGYAFLHGGINYWIMGVLGIVTYAALALFAHTKHDQIVESLRMRFATFDLAQELRVQRDAADRANVAKSKFLAAASHDLRQPLHALTLLGSALRNTDIGREGRRIAADMGIAIASLEKMFNGLLDVSRLDAGVLHPEITHFDLGELLQRIATSYTIAAQEKGLQLVLEAESVVARSDPLLLERIVRNLLSNAVRYTPSGSIRLSAVATDEGIRVEVADTGIGIALDQQTEIFNEFYQVDNPERDRAKGLGLGLAIVKRIANLLDHPIGVDSSPGRGSRFYLTVPRGERARLADLSAKAIAAPTALDGLRVLVIDDDVVVRESTRALLSSWNCEVAVAEDVHSALQLTDSEGELPEALIVDYRLRCELTGVDAIARLRSYFEAEIPALIVTGDTAPDRLREVAASGHTLAHKPVQPAVLRAFLRSALRAKRSAMPAYLSL